MEKTFDLGRYQREITTNSAESQSDGTSQAHHHFNNDLKALSASSARSYASMRLAAAWAEKI